MDTTISRPPPAMGPALAWSGRLLGGGKRTSASGRHVEGQRLFSQRFPARPAASSPHMEGRAGLEEGLRGSGFPPRPPPGEIHGACSRREGSSDSLRTGLHTRI